MSAFDEIGERVFRRRYDSLDLNVGVVAGARGLLVVDTRVSHAEADELRFELSTFTAAPVVAVVNTHFHWDHVWGNARFPGIPIWGHRRCREQLLDRGEQMKAHILAGVDDGRR